MIIAFISFDPTVWGTVADWTVSIAAIVSGIFLYSTLKSQIEVATLSENQYRRSIMPYFLIPLGNQYNDDLLDVTFILYQNPAFNARFFVDGKQFQDGLHPLPKNMPVSYRFNPILSSKNIERLRFDKEEEDQLISLRFSDVDGNLYEQSFIRDTYDGVSLTYPRLLESAPKMKKHWQWFF